jgi:hypothetical protein
MLERKKKDAACGPRDEKYRQALQGDLSTEKDERAPTEKCRV